MSIESSITRSVMAYMNSLPGCIAEKVKGSSSSSGRADINACYKGRSIRIEMKTPDHKNTASKKQEHNLEKWYKAGSVVMVAYSLKSVKKALFLIDEGETGEFYRFEENGCKSWVRIPSL